MHHIGMKRRFLSFGVGLLVLGGVFSLVAFVSNDARLSYAMGAITVEHALSLRVKVSTIKRQH
jgi:hypothetical protein